MQCSVAEQQRRQHVWEIREQQQKDRPQEQQVAAEKRQKKHEQENKANELEEASLKQLKGRRADPSVRLTDSNM